MKAEKDGTSIKVQQNAGTDDGKVLNGFFLVTFAAVSARIRQLSISDHCLTSRCVVFSTGPQNVKFGKFVRLLDY